MTERLSLPRWRDEWPHVGDVVHVRGCRGVVVVIHKREGWFLVDYAQA